LSWPFAIIRRNVTAVIDPSGKASAAAVSSRNGVLSVIASRAGIWMLHIAGIRRPPFFAGAEVGPPMNEVQTLLIGSDHQRHRQCGCDHEACDNACE